MIYALRELGNLIIKNALGKDPSALLPYFVDKAPYEEERVGERDKPLILALHFKTDEDCVELEELCEADAERAEEYLWIGNAPRNSPQNRLTTQTLPYLISQTIPNLLDKRKGLPPNSRLYSLLSSIRERFFCKAREFGVQGKEGEKWIINIEKVKSFSHTRLPLPFKGNYNELLSELSKLLEDDLAKKSGRNRIPQNSLYTVLIDGEPIAKHSDYSQYMWEFFLKEPFGENLRARCHICAREAEVTKEYTATRFRFTYYIMDKIGFASGITKEGFYKNFSLCKDCYSALLVAEKFVWQNLRSSLGGRDFCLIPSFLHYLPLSLNHLLRLSTYLKNRFKAVETMEGYNEFRVRLEEHAEEEEQSKAYSLNLIFYYNPQSREFRVLKLIEDVPPSRLDVLNQVTNDVKMKADGFLGENRDWYIGMECISRLLHPQQKRRGVANYKYLLDFYESLLVGKSVEYQPLIERFNELSKRKFYDPMSTDRDFARSLIQTNLLIAILRDLNILKGGDFNSMNFGELRLPDDIKAYMEECRLNEPRGALFLLGYLIGEIGYAQHRAGSSKKPVLDKITFQGMNLNKLMRLSNEVFDKLRQYGLLDYKRETIHSAMKRLMDKNFSSWRMSDQENVYWVLSGYAFSTWEREKKPKEETLGEEESNE